jgi:RHS repeat-associated protein
VDRLGSIRWSGDYQYHTTKFPYYPYGEEYATTTQDRDKYGTYYRDGSTGLDYARNRYYASTYGRFMTADPYQNSAGAADPGSWNRYAYVGDDPVNSYDPSGLVACNPDSPACQFPWDSLGGGGGGPLRAYSDSDQHGGGGGGGSAFDWKTLSVKCKNALAVAMPKGNLSDGVAMSLWIGALNRAYDAESVLESATKGTDIAWTMLAAIGVRESGFQNLNEKDGAGVGVGVFQITVSGKSGVTPAQAGDLTWAANWAAKLLNSNMDTLAAAHQNLNPRQLLQATAAAYNFGTKNISGNPNTIDVGTARNNYGSNVLNLMDCFH